MTKEEQVCQIICCGDVCQKGGEQYSICQRHTFITEAKRVITYFDTEATQDAISDAIANRT